MDIGEKRFCWLLKQRGYKYWTEKHIEEKIIEEQAKKGLDIRVTKKPDFFVETPFGNIMVEVESLKEPSILEIGERITGSFDFDKLLNRLREPVHLAAKQLKPYQNLNIPFLVVIDNWRQVRVPTDANALLQIFGTFEFQVNFEEKNGEIYKVGPTIVFHGKNKRLAEDRHTYISAVAVNIPKYRDVIDNMEKERPMYLRIIHNPFAQCPMSTEVFSSVKDEQYCFRENKGWFKI